MTPENITEMSQEEKRKTPKSLLAKPNAKNRGINSVGGGYLCGWWVTV